MNKITVIHVTKKKYIEFFGKTHFLTYKDSLKEHKGAYIYYISKNNKPLPYFNLTFGEVTNWEERGYMVFYLRQVLTEKWEYR